MILDNVEVAVPARDPDGPYVRVGPGKVAGGIGLNPGIWFKRRIASTNHHPISVGAEEHIIRPTCCCFLFFSPGL